jgi:hypothetical protein
MQTVTAEAMNQSYNPILGGGGGDGNSDTE